MCGIAGYIKSPSAEGRESRIRKMVRSLEHRGPDSEGYYEDTDISLGFARLSIIDLKTGGQPFISSEHVLVCNGEIYNSEALRQSERSYPFTTHSDCEVILPLYEKRGVRCMEPLEGMFAFALWDKREKSLLLARDLMGIKPLYFYEKNGEFAFASELKALLAYGISKDLEPAALESFFRTLTVKEPFSIFKNVRKVPAGHFLLYKKGKVTLKPYRDFEVSQSTEIGEEEEVAQEMRKRFRKSVIETMQSDVPIGMFLSGGLDSSILLSVMHNESSQPVNTFSVGFKEAASDESSYSRMVSGLFKTNHEEITLGEKDAVDALHEFLPKLDEPFADASAIPTYCLAKRASNSVKVVLTGEGADELFAGNYWHRDEFIRKRKTYFYNEEICFGKSEFKKLLGGSSQEKGVSADCNLAERLTWDLKNYLPSDMLVKLDRMTMLNGLEGRVPYLNPSFVEYVAQIPPSLKIKNSEQKYILKKAFVDAIPHEIIARPKKGFSIPMDIWLWKPGPFRSLVEDVLLGSGAGDTVLDNRFIEKLWKEHDSFEKLHGYRLWMAFIFKVWCIHSMK